MFLKNFQIVFLIFTITGTIVAVSSNSWFIRWLGLEINLMRIIPLLLRDLNFKATESSIKYFLAQALASIILVTSAIAEIIFNFSYLVDNFNYLIIISLLIKAGLAPFHFWFPQVIIFLNWFKCLLILIWQKIAPFILLSYLNNRFLIIIIVTASALTGALGGLNQINIKLLLTYSSIAHSGWMILISSISTVFWILYFIVYRISTIPIVLFFNKYSSSNITEINKFKINPTNKILLISLILSLGGLPPFLGFSAKLFTIILRIKIFPIFLIIILISSSLVSLFFYTKIFFNVTTLNSNSKKIILLRGEEGVNRLILILILGNLIISFLVLLT